MLKKSSLPIPKINRTIKLLTIFMLFFWVKTYGQVSLSVSELNYGKVPVHTLSTRNLLVKNNFPTAASFEITYAPNSGYTVTPAEFFLNPGDSQMVAISFSPAQNLSYKNVLMVKEVFTGISAFVRVYGDGAIDALYDAATFNKWDGELKSALTALTANHTSLGYNTGRDRMFENIDLQTGDTIECVYTGRKVKAATRTIAQNQNFNTEHTWPQSFFNEADPMKSDIYHLYPTDATSNSQRGNYDFGKVVSGITWQVGGSKLGKNYLNQTVFEPRDVHKGDVARSLFYFVTRYGDLGGYFDTLQQSVLREWHSFDSVSAREAARNTKIAQYQGKRNPYIDHPGFVNRIYTFTGTATTPRKPQAVVSADTIRMRYEWVGENSDSAVSWFYIGNTSLGNLTYTTNFQNSEVFKLYLNDNSVNYGEVDSIMVVFSPLVAGDFMTEAVISTNDGLFRLPIFGTAVAGNTEPFSVSPISFSILGNYPNPFNGSTVVRYSVNVPQQTALRIYTVSGEMAMEVFNEEKAAGEYTQQINFSNLPSGVYFVLLSGLNNYIAHPIHHLK